MIKQLKKNIYICFMLATVFLNLNCKKFVAIDPPAKELSTKLIFEEDATATSAVLGLYLKLWNFGYYVASATGLSSDELKSLSTWDQNQIQFYENRIHPNNSYTNRLWDNLYSTINQANSILEGLEKSILLTTQLKHQLEGETRFMRAACFFYLVNFFDEVPIITTTDFRVSGIEPRGKVENVYALIIEDLVKAQNLLEDNYVTAGRVRINKSSAIALLARAYLYRKDWQKAETESSKVINNTALYTLNSDLNAVFLANSSETILQFFPSTNGSINATEGAYFIPIFGTFTLSGTLLSDELVNSFEPGDNRKDNWVKSFTDGGQTFYHAFKYKIFVNTTKTEYSTTLRLGEQYLIRSEARAQLNNISGSQADLNVIRARAGLSNTGANDKSTLLQAIENERRVELFTEWGHRWFDLKRYSKADAVLSSIKAPNWQPTDTLYPIPERELIINPNMTQNAGY